MGDVLGSVAVAILVGAFALAGTKFGANQASKQWIRTERAQAYANALAALDRSGADGSVAVRNAAYAGSLSVPLDEAMKILVDGTPELARLAVAGPERVYEAARFLSGRLADALVEQMTSLSAPEIGTVARQAAGAAREEFISECRKALKTAR